jgi:hypothetical protein
MDNKLCSQIQLFYLVLAQIFASMCQLSCGHPFTSRAVTFDLRLTTGDFFVFLHQSRPFYRRVAIRGGKSGQLRATRPQNTRDTGSKYR